MAGLWAQPTPLSQLLVTTRRRDSALFGSGRELIEISPFSSKESSSYLTRKLADRPEVLDEADQLASDLGQLPLALSQAAAYMMDRGITCGIYRRRFADRRGALADMFPEDEALPDDYQHPVGTTWSLSIESADQLNPRGWARRALAIAALLSPNGIPVTLFTSRPATAYIAGCSDTESIMAAEKAMDSLHNLQRFNLVTLDSDAGLVRIHSLTQRAARELNATTETDSTVHVAADALMDVWEEYEPDAILSQYVRSNAVALLQNSVDDLLLPQVHPLFFRTGHSIGGAGQAREADRFFQQLHADCQRLLGASHPHTLQAQVSASTWLAETGKAKEALASLRAMVPIHEAVLGPEHADTLSLKLSVATWTGQTGDVAKAGAMFDELLPQCRSLFGPDSRQTLIARHYVARWVGHKGEVHKATNLYRSLVEDQARVLEPSDPEALVTRDNLSYWLGRQGDLRGAVEMVSQVVGDWQSFYGLVHLDALTSRHNLAYWTGQSGRSQEALLVYRDLIGDQIRVLGEEHPTVLRSRHNIAMLEGETGWPRQALRHLIHLVADQVTVLGKDHPEVLRARHNVAFWTFLNRHPKLAAAQLRYVLQMQRNKLGAAHPAVNTTRHSLAIVLAYCGRREQAVYVLGRLLDHQQSVNPNSLDALVTAHSLAHFSGLLNGAGSAVRLIEDLARKASANLGTDHPLTLKMLFNHARWLFESNSVESARNAAEILLPRVEHVFTESHPLTLRLRFNHAVWSVGSDFCEESSEILNELLISQCRMLEPRHPDTERTRTALGLLHEQCDRISGLAHWERIPPIEHPIPVTRRTARAG